jgi:uncharacterized protein (DUF2267 family)
MTQPPEILYASKLYQDWLNALRDQAMLATHNQAQAIMRAVFHELRRHMDAETVMRFADALPPLPRGILIEHWRCNDPVEPLASAEAFTRDVFRSLSPHVVPPDDIVAHVFDVLATRSIGSNAHAMRDLLPEVLKPLWPSESR